MAISQYWTGQIPGAPISIAVRNSDGFVMDLSSYIQFNVKLLGSDNEELDLTGAVLETAGANTGRFVFRWPTDRSLFQKSGEYLLQLELVGAGKRDYTTVHTIRVRRLGGAK